MKKQQELGTQNELAETVFMELDAFTEKYFAAAAIQYEAYTQQELDEARFKFLWQLIQLFAAYVSMYMAAAAIQEHIKANYEEQLNKEK